MAENKINMNNFGKKLLARRELALVVLLLVLLIPITIKAPGFLSPKNLDVIINDVAILVIVSIAQFLAILSGGIDLSVGSIIAFTGMACGMINQDHPGVPIALIILVGIALGCLMGAVNGVLVAYGKIPPIITTLGTVNIYRGATFVLSKNTWVTAHEMTDAFKAFPRNRILGITTLTWISILVVVIMYIFMRYTRAGRSFYAIGGNAGAAKFCGVNEQKSRFLVFTISGTLCGLAGFLWTVRYASAVNEMAQGFEMNAVASCVLGGVNFAGGAGAIPGVVIGSLFFGVINNALPNTLSTFWKLMAQGLIVLIAMIINTTMDYRKAQKALRERRIEK